jgi:hypothetical protein
LGNLPKIQFPDPNESDIISLVQDEITCNEEIFFKDICPICSDAPEQLKSLWASILCRGKHKCHLFSHDTQQVSREKKVSSGDLQRVMPLEWDIHEISTCTCTK